MGIQLKITRFALAVMLCTAIAGRADTQTTPVTHRAHSKKKTVPPPLPSGTQGPVPQVPLDAIPAVAPEVSYENGLLTINAPNSTLGDILRSVRKHTSADIEIPAAANERVAMRLGPAPAREVMAQLLNGSRFNYILLGSPEDANALVRVVLVAKTPDTPAGQPGHAANGAQPPVATNPTADAEAEAAEENVDESADQNAAEAEQPAASPDQPGIKTPQQLLQEMQQRQLQMQQQQANQPGASPVMPAPHQPQPQQDQ
ncbi:MAG TPA: hypothetical protein VFF50_14120 [Candidatus Deferrimicrobiaceae bacterium]|jgi:hypothetical protein|nr:hypothetical protein [Candidatus Deferrimicrobiaceae bacterium]